MDSDTRCPGELRGRPQIGDSAPLAVRDLTRRMARGDEVAFRQFYDAYYERLSRYLLVVTRGDEGATSEALQGMLVRVVKHIRVFSDEHIFWSWLTVLSRTSLSDHKRTKRRYLAFLDRFRALHESVPKLAHQETDRSLFEILDSKLTQLPEQERKLIRLKYFEHFSVRDVALQMNSTEKSVESSLARIRGKLKRAVLLDLKNE